MDSSLIIALAALLFSIASPFFSELIRGHFRLKEKRLDAELEREKQNQEFYRRHRAEVIENFILAAGRAVKHPVGENIDALGAASGEIYLYVDKSLWLKIDSIRENLPHGNLEEAETAFVSLCKKLSQEEVRAEYQPEPDRRYKDKPDRV